MVDRLNNKIALVTGAGQGIGEAIARAFAQEGADIIIAEHNEKTGQAVAQSISNTGRRAIFIKTDVADPNACEATVRKANVIRSVSVSPPSRSIRSPSLRAASENMEGT